MTMPEVVFEEPTPSHGRGSTARVLAVRAAIDARPGEWALLPTGMAIEGFRRAGYGVTTRRAKDGTSKSYVRSIAGLEEAPTAAVPAE